uniref:Uncharacterized protein n=1 Tax=Rhizophora mucronata TaxID=61149 RepID=A0A2P2J775_RHIMU
MHSRIPKAVCSVTGRWVALSFILSQFASGNDAEPLIRWILSLNI